MASRLHENRGRPLQIRGQECKLGQAGLQGRAGKLGQAGQQGQARQQGLDCQEGWAPWEQLTGDIGICAGNAEKNVICLAFCGYSGTILRTSVTLAYQWLDVT